VLENPKSRKITSTDISLRQRLSIILIQDLKENTVGSPMFLAKFWIKRFTEILYTL